MAKIIVGIHGLANKPTKEKLAEWWKRSISEGLEKNCGIANAEFDFQMVHWADLLYKYPVHQNNDFKFDKLFNDEPYIDGGGGPFERYDDGMLDNIIASTMGVVGATLDFAKEHFEMSRLAARAPAPIKLN